MVFEFIFIFITLILKLSFSEMKKNQKFEKESTILALGELNITLKIDFKDEDLLKEQEEKTGQKKYYKLRHLTDLSSLSFLHKREDILKRFKLSSNNETIKLLLIGNQNIEKKSIIDYICFGAPIFINEEEYFNDVLDFITKRYGIIFNKKPLNINAGYYIKIEMNYEGKKQEIIIESKGNYEHEEDNYIKEEGDNYSGEEDDEDDDYPLNEAMIKKLIPKFRKRNILCNIYPLFSKYDMLYFNYEDLWKISVYFKIEYTLELIDFFRKKKTIIFINYYKQEKDNNITENNQQKDLFEYPKPNKKILTNEELLELVNKFYYVTDVYFFDKKQAIKSFNDHYNLFTTDDTKKVVSSKNVYDYFIKGIATGTEDKIPNDKSGIFLDEFNEFCLIQVTKNSVFKQDYDAHPFPKINTHNITEVNQYKELIKKNKNELYSLFLSEIIISTSYTPKNNSVTSSIIYPGYLTGMELIKKRIEYLLNNIDVTEDEKFYKIKKHHKVIAEELDKLKKSEKEGKFLLDCTNKLTSNKKEYVSLFDFHLKNFFSSQINRKNLENKGFIDSEGYIIYDPLYKNSMNKKKKKFTEKEIKNKLMTNIKDIKTQTILQNNNINDINLFNNDNFNMTTGTKIPFIKDKNNIDNKKKKINTINNKKGFSNNIEFNSGYTY